MLNMSYKDLSITKASRLTSRNEVQMTNLKLILKAFCEAPSGQLSDRKSIKLSDRNATKLTESLFC